MHSLHLQAGDDEEESGPHASQVAGPKESAACHHTSPIPTFGGKEFPLGGVRTPRHPLKLGGSAPCTPPFREVVDEIIDVLVDVIADVYVGTSVDM